MIAFLNLEKTFASGYEHYLKERHPLKILYILRNLKIQCCNVSKTLDFLSLSTLGASKVCELNLNESLLKRLANVWMVFMKLDPK